MHAIQRSAGWFELSSAAIRVTILALAVAGSVALAAHTAFAKTFYLDGTLGGNCGAGTYSIAARACSGADGDAYNTLAGAITNLIGGDTLYVRSGTYIRTTNQPYGEGSLSVTRSGTASQHTVIGAYPGEQPVICTENGRCQYNPNPSDTSVTVCNGSGGQGGAACYYPNPAISIGGNYIDVIGFKTYGQVLISGAMHVTLQDSDIGGGGPYFNWGYVVFINASSDITVKNNKIHHSSWGENGVGHAASLASYTSKDYVVENNEFYDAYARSVQVADTQGMGGGTITIRYNFFRPSTITSDGGGFGGILQYDVIDTINVHNNIFYKTGIWLDSSASLGTFMHNNTFIDSNSDIQQWNDQRLNAQNNLHYHSTGSQFHYNLASSLGNITSNYNLYYTATGTTTWKTTGCNTTSFTTWKTCSGKDAGSITNNPNFANPTGNRPKDFKRTSYPNEVSGSVYGTVTGAYETGNELIGLTGGATPPDTTPPRAPTGLVVN